MSGDERKAYELGERLLRSMDGAMPVLPDGQKLSLSFEGGQMVLMVPPAFLDKFRLQAGDPGAARHPDADATARRGPPRLIFPDRGPAFAGIPLRRPVWALDDSGGPTADIQLSCDGALPEGIRWNDTGRLLEGVPRQPGSRRLVFRAKSPAGTDSLAWDLVVSRNHPPAFLDTPDTAWTGRSWHFRPTVGDSDHSLSLVRVLPRHLPPGAKWDSAAVTVSWTPPDSLAGTGQILSLVAIDPLGDSTLSTWKVPVAVVRDAPPRFLSELGRGDPRVDVPLTYRPVAISGNGTLLPLKAILPAGSPMAWDGTHLSLRARKPGLYEAELLAEDTRGRQTRQVVAWDVRPAHRTNVFLETRWEADLAPWQVGVDFGTGRLGLFTPSVGRLFGWSQLQDQEWPYLFLGANLLDEAARNRGDRLTADVGLTVRIPKSSLYTGGFYGRISGRIAPRSSFALETEYDIQGWIRQAVLVADSNVLSTVTLTPNQQAQFRVNDPRWTASKMVTIRDIYWDAVQRTLDESRADDNVVLLSNLWAWAPVGAGLKCGAGVWRVDKPLAGIAHQSVGGGVKGGWDLGRLRLEPSIRAGWGPAGAGFSAWGSLLAGFDASRGRR